MRRFFVLVAMISLAVVPGRLLAQQRPKLQVTNVRLGFPSGYVEEVGERQFKFKAGSWSPVSVDIQVGRDGLKGTEGRIDVVVETPDSDDVLTNYSVNVPLEKLGPNEQFTVATFTKLAGVNNDVSVTLYYDGQPLAQPFKKSQSGQAGVDANQSLYLALGSRLPNLRRAMVPDPLDNQQNQGRKLDKFDPRENLAFVEAIHQMPLHWFGYEGVDLVILSTSNRDFLKKLDAADKRYREALAEWVLRGGHLIVSVGANQDAVAAFPEIQQLLPVNITKSEPVAELEMLWHERDGGKIGPLPNQTAVASLERKPGRDFHPLMKSLGGRAGEDLIVQGAAGLGCVTVVAFDFDQRPFTEWKGKEVNVNAQTQFWIELIKSSWPRDGLVRVNENNNQQMPMRGFYGENMDNQLLGELYRYLENFEEVPVISFGWVALFIFLYILVVGPLDYFFLKKVVKRLELTWITFPTVVLFISAVAYFTAYYIKGKDLRIRKVDMVDVDMTGPQPMLVGHTWFTLFSPRIQHYTIGVEPAQGAWVPEMTDAANPRGPNVTVSWLGRPENNPMNMPRNRGQSLFRRAYEYEPAAGGLRGVPIQVWSTKSFTASWQAPGNTQRPLVAAKLSRKGKNVERSSLVGEVTWLPDQSDGDKTPELKDAYLIYNNQAIKLALKPGAAFAVNTDNMPIQPEISRWFDSVAPPANQTNNYGRRGYGNSQTFTNIDYPMRGAMFFDKLLPGNRAEQNSGLRMLDQSWRLKHAGDSKNAGQAILVGRLSAPAGPAEDLTQNMVSATRLWLGATPLPGAARPRVEGILHQDTYIRVFLPVQN